jgi:RHS repeat-associated protein
VPHLRQIAQGRTTTATFAYDAFGRRMHKAISGTTTQFLYDGLNPVQELNSGNTVVANLMTGLGLDEYFSRTASGTTSTFIADALGSTIGLVSVNNGPIATNYNYQPFGAMTVVGSTNSNSYEFTGRENDATGLYFYRARYYSPTFQKFAAQDPIDFMGGDTNLYALVQNSPANAVDSTGLIRKSPYFPYLGPPPPEDDPNQYHEPRTCPPCFLARMRSASRSW